MKWRVAVAVSLALLSIAGHAALRSMRPRPSSAVEESALAVLGGFRAVLSEVMWFRADRLQREGRYAELAQLARALTLAEPHTPEVWCYAAWNLAYNVSVTMPTPEDRWRWVSSAIRLLRDDGLRLNPTSPELHRELAWLFELKLGTDIDSAAATYREKWREIAEEAEKAGWESIGMDPRRMEEVERRFGPMDRRDPRYSAVYWASRGLENASGNDRAFLLQIIRQSLMLYAKDRKGEPVGG